LLDSVVYLYPTAVDANDGISVGGSGFLVSAPDAAGQVHVFAVSNSHVVLEPGRSPVIRLAAADGSAVALPLAAEDWTPHPEADDVAVAHLGTEAVLARYRWQAVARDLFVSAGMFDGGRAEYGPGSDCFMVGRFVSHEGGQRNTPIARFGHLSMPPGERVRDGRGLLVEALLVEMRSQSGFSGSPVFIYRSVWPVVRTGQTQRVLGGGGMDLVAAETFRPHLLGVDSGHLPHDARILDAQSGEPDAGHDGLLVRVTSGVSTIVPAWRLASLLDEVLAARG
jgi:hypothetical protein